MKTNFTLTMRRVSFVVLLLIGTIFSTQAQTAICDNFDTRKDEFIQKTLQRGGSRALYIAQAYKGLPVNRQSLASNIANLREAANPDFAINEYVRLLYISNGEYDDIIMPVLRDIPFWLPDNTGNKRQYWSENHMIQWMASDWLLKQKYSNWQTRSNLRSMIVTYLDAKIRYGYYEYLSYYNAFTMTALLNLYDFAEDQEIKSKAKQALLKMLKDHMLVTNNQGGILPVSGRYEIKSLRPDYYGSVTYMMTGLGPKPNNVPRETLASIAMATSGLDLAPICQNWSPEVNTTLNYGHNINRFNDVYPGLARQDRNMFQWSAGGYFSPELARETLWQIDHYDLWDHIEFDDYSFARFLPPFLAGTISRIGATVSRGSYIGEAKIGIFKNRGIVLNTSQSIWQGRVGFQIYPIVANIENSRVFLQSGKVYSNVLDIPGRKSNEHLPKVKQSGNVSLIMYRPNRDIEMFGYDDLDVSLRWNEADYDELATIKRWSVGRKGESYVAILKHCKDKINGVPACSDKDGQTWAVVVGNKQIHGSFSNFKQIISRATYEEKWIRKNRFRRRWNYYGKVSVDGKTLDYEWAGDNWDRPGDTSSSSSASDRVSNTPANENTKKEVLLLPNPAKDFVTIQLEGNKQENISAITISNQMGAPVYQNRAKSSENLNKETIQTRGWQPGVYSVIIEHANGTVSIKKLMINN